MQIDQLRDDESEARPQPTAPTLEKGSHRASIGRWAYYNLLTAHDVLQAAAWRLIAPKVDENVFQGRYKMVFVLGCGRSGTTILSRCLGQHAQIAELNEPAHVWIGTHAETDILSLFAGLLRGRLRLDCRDATSKIRARYRAMLDYQVNRQTRFVCDKLPQNTFRVDFLNAVCPGAKFILIERSPRAVARSIERCVERDGAWWGFNDYKWQSIASYASTHPELAKLVPYATDHYYRGLIEWRVTQELANSDLVRIEPERQMRVAYDDFCTRPEEIMSDIFAFCGVPNDPTAMAYARANVSPSATESEPERQSAEDDRRHAVILGTPDPALPLDERNVA